MPGFFTLHVFARRRVNLRRCCRRVFGLLLIERPNLIKRLLDVFPVVMAIWRDICRVRRCLSWRDLAFFGLRLCSNKNRCIETWRYLNNSLANNL